ncbi:MAG: mechanosensitive ion channel family protein [Bacteroidota bacterium]
MEHINEYINSVLSNWGLTNVSTHPLKAFFFLLIITVLAIILNWIAKFLIMKLVRKLVRKSKNRWDDVFLEKHVFQRLSHLAPVLVIYLVAPAFMAEFPIMVDLAYLAANLYLIFIFLIVFYALLDAIGAIYNEFEIARTKPIKGYLQVTKIISGIVAVIFALATILDKSPVYIFTGLGALTAVLLLVFRDTILNFVAGVQVTANNLVEIGDWIEMPKYGADGDVIDISLNTVLIRNFDRTLTTIPTYALVSDSFKNWRGMVQTGGRRIMRNIYIDINTIRGCDEEMLERFSKVSLLKDYIAKRKAEIEAHNKKYNLDPENPLNGRRMTNIGILRAYITHYLQRHPSIHKELTCMVRQMQPQEKGLPLQIYAFTNDINWVNYEAIQADIFDHILSVVSQFDLKIFQLPSQIQLSVTPTK